MLFHYLRSTILVVSLLICVCAGCTAHYSAVHVGRPDDHTIDGFRYFLPKPYLLVTNLTTAATPAPAKADNGKGDSGEKGVKDSADKFKGKPDDGGASPAPPNSTITVQLLWLPDTKEEYAVVMKGHSIGTFEGKLQLDNGWMLTSVNEKSDAKVAETLTAFSGLLSNVFAAAGLPTVSTASKGVTAQGEAPRPLAPFLYLFEVDLEGKTLQQVDSASLNNLLLHLKCMDPCPKPADQPK